MSRGVAGSGKTTDRSVKGSGGAPKQSAPASAPSGGPGGGGSGGSGGGGGGSSAKQKDTIQAQLNNTAANYQKRKDDLDKNTQDYFNELEGSANKWIANKSGEGQSYLENINQQMLANDSSRDTNRFNNMRDVKYQPSRQKEQSTFMALRNRMGNSAYGSGLQDLVEGMSQINDMNDVEAIDTWRQNENNLYGNWYQSNQGLVADYNKQITDIDSDFSQFALEYENKVSQLKNKYNDEISSLNSQYASTMSNISPLLMANVNGVSDTAKALTRAKNVQAAVKAGSKKGLSSKEKKAYNAIMKDAKSSAKGSKAVAKAASKAAKAAVTKANKANKSAADNYKMPKTDLEGKANLVSTVNITPNEALRKLMVRKENADSQSELTKNFIRPAYAPSDTNLGATIDTSRAANSGFADNLAAFRRV